ncbi:PREDICTED: uncharacterized protein LOC104587884 [Nelumbo nucifera]|uniref:Uncharacterized protein LOC104587884 n=2 Tax=Nelumbo nucifera TaxID=4432 RepID=A0A1U8PYJ2_NELNU|nr:PREDICTED: uncharacterized protein LOC104587884 [Nelumbo nucifera]XP_010243943.1 PREDICTED: uncharacterized protein LOC104587884 [Nelumbo nucifera]XP_019051617.1 PREDICTED: uncharacterized protein LOC104587884 [Nelumbo nucifera]DAD20212.1 TPA_asm: hypothetical protein HUJ06_021675 [Nelumbo nucifera]
MSTLEKLFIQIFERKNWIIEQVKQQKELYEQHLAAKLLINGIRHPPSWFEDAGFGNGCVDLEEMKKEELISGLLLRPPQSTVSIASGQCILYNKPVVTTNNEQFCNDFFTETCASNKYFEVGDRLTVVPKCHLNESDLGRECTLDSVPELSFIASSPQTQTDAVVSNTCFDPGQSLARIQRSKSRQKALELRNSAKTKTGGRPRKEDDTNVHSDLSKRSRNTCQWPDSVKEPVEFCKFSDVAKESAGSVAKAKSRKHASQEKNSCAYMHSSRSAKSETSCKQPNNVKELAELHNSSENAYDGSGRVASYRSASMHLNSIGEPSGWSRQDVELQNALGTQASIHKSRSREKDLEFSNCLRTNKERCPSNGGFISEDIPITDTHTWSRSVPDDKSSEIAKALNCAEGHDPREVSDHQVNILQCDIVDKERCDGVAAETECISDVQHKMNRTNCRGALEFLVSRPPSEDSTFVEPKQLVFDDVEGCSLNENFDPSLVKDIQLVSSEEGPVTSKTPDESLKKITISSDKKCDLYVDKELLDKEQVKEVLNRKKQVSGSPSEAEVVERFKLVEFEKPQENSTSVIKSSKSTLPSGKAAYEICEGALTDTSLESNILSNQIQSTDSLLTLQAGRKSSVGSKEAVSPDLNVDQQRDDFVQTCNQDLLLGPMKIFLEDHNPEPSKCNHLKGFVDPDSHAISGFNPYMNCTMLLGAHETKASCVIAADAMKESIIEKTTAEETEENHHAKQDSPFHVRSLTSHHQNDSCSKSEGSRFRTDSIKRSINRKTASLEQDHNADEVALNYVRSSIDNGQNGNCSKSHVSFVATSASDRSILRKAASLNIDQNHNSERGAHYFLRSSTSNCQNDNVEQGPRYFLRSSASICQNAGCSKSDGSRIAKKSLQLTKAANAAGGSWPQYKRRKIDSQSSNVSTASPKVLTWVKPPQKMENDNALRCMESAWHVSEGKLELEVKDQGANNNPLTVNHQQSEYSFDSSSEKEVIVKSRGCLKDEVGILDPTSTVLDEIGLPPYERILNVVNMENLGCSEGTMQGSHLGEDMLFSYCSVSSQSAQDLDLVGADQAMPEFEGFNVGVLSENTVPCLGGEGVNLDKLGLPCTTIERDSILEQFYRSGSMLTPLPPVSMKYKLHMTPDVYQSFPKCSYSGMSEKAGHTFLGSSFSSCMPSSSVLFGRDSRKPTYTPPVSKLSQRITSKSNSGSSNPELTCFRIEEDPIICEETRKTVDVVDPFQEGTHARESNSSIKTGPLVDFTTDPPASISAAMPLKECSVDCQNAESGFTGTRMDVKQKDGNGCGSNRRYRSKKGKENQSSLVGMNCALKASGSLQSRFGRPKLSGKESEGKGCQSISEKGSKRNNIVSNISSFIPLVQQKQVPAVLMGKRDIKVKALEAAETAKRLEEKREKERKMRKEAVKLERARLEQENIQKKKEEDRKKKEAEIAARKRLREEEERKEREKKRKCNVEAQRQQREHENKLRVEKEEKEPRHQLADERQHKGKELTEGPAKQQKIETGKEGPKCRKETETDPRTAIVSAANALKVSIVPEHSGAFKELDDVRQVPSNLANEDCTSATDICLEQSYDISPYQGSDDEEEEEEEDDIPNKKLIPSWASESCLAQTLPSLQKLDPKRIFPIESFCSIAEVLLSRKQQLK